MNAGRLRAGPISFGTCSATTSRCSQHCIYTCREGTAKFGFVIWYSATDSSSQDAKCDEAAGIVIENVQVGGNRAVNNG